MAAENELYSLEKILEIADKFVEIYDEYGIDEKAHPKSIVDKVGELRYRYLFPYLSQNKKYYEDYYFDRLRYYVDILESSSIESKTKQDLIYRINKILLNHSWTYDMQNCKEGIKKTVYIRNSINKLMKFLKVHKLYNYEDKYFLEYLDKYFDFVIIYHNFLVSCIAVVHYYMEKHVDLKKYSSEWEKLDTSYNDGEFREVLFILLDLYSRTYYTEYSNYNFSLLKKFKESIEYCDSLKK